MPGLPALARGRHAGRGRRRERELPLSWWRLQRRERARHPRTLTVPAGFLAATAPLPGPASRSQDALGSAESAAKRAAQRAAQEAARTAGPRPPRKPAPVPRTQPAVPHNSRL